MQIKSIIIIFIISLSYLFGDAPSISIESKYGQGTKIHSVTNAEQGDYYYNENIMDINFNFDSGIYLYTQLEYSSPPFKGLDFVGMNNYHLDITISGPIDERSGFIINLKTLNKIVKQRVINVLDHSQIEKDIDWFKYHQPSTENMVMFIWDRIASHIPSTAKLYSIKLQETPTIYTEYFGPENDDK